MSPLGRPASMPPSLSASGPISVTPRSSHLEMARRKGTLWQREKDPSVGWSSRRGRTERSDGRRRRDGCPLTRFLLSSVGRLVPLGGLEAVAVPVGRQHGGMVHDTVDDGRGGGRIQEHLGPAGERQIA